MEKTDWPIYYAENLVIGNSASSVGVATLWTPKELFQKKLKADTYRLIGQLYSNDGINPLLRNVLANPCIRTIVLCGQDRIGSADALACLMKNGINAKGEVIGKEEARVEQEIPVEAVELFRANVTLIDKRGIMNPAEIQKVIDDCEQQPELWAEPQLFPEPDLSTDRFPSEGAAYTYRGKTMAEVWPKLLHGLLRFGEEKQTNYGTKQKELLDVTAVITDEDPASPDLPDYLPFTLEHFEQYKPQVLSAEPLPTLSYTYGMRLRNFDGVNQVEAMISKLKAEPWTRQAVAVLWDVATDNDSEHPPCLNIISALVKDDELVMTCFFRSNDMFRAWPENALALRCMQKEIAEAVGIDMGPLTTISASAHIYEENIPAAREIIETAYPKLPCEQDRRGNYVIKLLEGAIEVTHLSPVGRKLEKFSGNTAMDLMNQIASNEGTSVFIHAMDLGAELQKAEIALKLGLQYTQDRPLPLK
ncbi:MAG: hypothetical protein COW24_05165 [Candidatus Kerfeldbacteria bacterium CG15_BIG_FIL_POST_REV_8_21_14_020_45_12]|uniref:Uncharacterized protein n=1 Tax=Candidatus Kerfeldbacteria bacterium CG15_BIG_FIL_POST_REV_8_21_14_020_45_12 TaxID=2014247 RepID=A0A2M7H2K5_9BACT|nr:MAG: hypothetical protein COW24_05165 [Candidatus Kerfeldbacteria bacterium CG15_BIG_FIL_POST_REV_8_21_14_020_45_12]